MTEPDPHAELRLRLAHAAPHALPTDIAQLLLEKVAPEPGLRLVVNGREAMEAVGADLLPALTATRDEAGVVTLSFWSYTEPAGGPSHIYAWWVTYGPDHPAEWRISAPEVVQR